MSTPDNDSARKRLLEYGTEFVYGYTQAIDLHFPEILEFIQEHNLQSVYFPLYGRQIGVNAAIAAFSTTTDFFMFFLEEPGVEIKACVDASDIRRFDRNWTFDTPIDLRTREVKGHLGIDEAKTFQVAPDSDVINIPGIDTMSPKLLPRIFEVGYRHGTGFGNQVGAWVKGEIPGLKERLKVAVAHATTMFRYTGLTQMDDKPQDRGREFEKLWREILEFHGWRPKKVRIPGEDNDFTAIYQGLHILGEVRWFDKPMNGAKMREFLAKLDPRPQTVGLFISHSGIDAGAWSVVRRAANSKTVVIFNREDIEQVMLRSADPGPIFDEKLRDAYDYIFEIDQG